MDTFQMYFLWGKLAISWKILVEIDEFEDYRDHVELVNV